MKLLVINNAEPADSEYNASLFATIAQLTDIQAVNYHDLPQLTDSLDNYAGAILSGVPIHYDFDTIDTRLPYLQWITHTQLPVLGICLGHQNIGRLYGAELIEDKEAEQGPQPLLVLQDDPLLAGINTGDEIIASHRGSIRLPAEFIQLASTSTCQNQVMRHATRAIYGAQFHPEFSPLGKTILSNFVQIAAEASGQKLSRADGEAIAS